VTTPREIYEETGYYLHPEPIVPAELVRRAFARIGALVSGEHDTGIPPWRRLNVGDPQKMQKIDQVHLCDKAFHLLATHPAIGACVAELTGADLVQVWATQLLIKPPRGGDLGTVGWHTDRKNWPFWEGEVLTVWLALDDIAPDAGPVLYVEGSHRWPDAEKHGDAYTQDLDSLEEQIKQRAPPRPWHKVPVVVSAGGVGVHASDTLHGSRANDSDVFRVGLGINVRTERSRVRPGVDDYGYASHLGHPFVCPIIHRRAPEVGRPRAAAADRGTVAPEVAFLAPLLREGMSLLDAGCGSGATTVKLAALLAPAVVTGIDADAGKIASARAAAQEAGLHNARFLEADVRRLPFADGTFDVVFSHALFGYLSSPEVSARELFRVCKPGGIAAARELLGFSSRLSVSVNGAERALSEILRELSRVCSGLPDAGVELKGALYAAGFRAVEASTTGEVYQAPADLIRLRGWLQPLLEGELGARAVGAGLLTEASLAELVAKLQDWPSDPAAIAVTSFIEYVARRPEVDGPR
jgi:SAM-dependent methyltransferase